MGVIRLAKGRGFASATLVSDMNDGLGRRSPFAVGPSSDPEPALHGVRAGTSPARTWPARGTSDEEARIR
jgi:hypothetical protein